MSEQRWVRVSQWRCAAFSLPCKGQYCWLTNRDSGTSCNNSDDQHGHIELRDDDEGGGGDWFAFIPFCCKSQAGVRAAVEFNNRLSQEEKNGILNLAEVKALPEELTEEEKIIISSPDEMEALAKNSTWWGQDRSN